MRAAEGILIGPPPTPDVGLLAGWGKMSLLNDVLRDLEQRQRPASDEE